MSKNSRSLLLFVCLCVPAFAADPTGAIAGKISDPSGAAVANAKVTATSLNTGFARSATSAADGGFVFPLMPVGPYLLTVETAGFRRFEQRGVEVKADASVNVPVSL